MRCLTLEYEKSSPRERCAGSRLLHGGSGLTADGQRLQQGSSRLHAAPRNPWWSLAAPIYPCLPHTSCNDRARCCRSARRTALRAATLLRRLPDDRRSVATSGKSSHRERDRNALGARESALGETGGCPRARSLRARTSITWSRRWGEAGRTDAPERTKPGVLAHCRASRSLHCASRRPRADEVRLDGSRRAQPPERGVLLRQLRAPWWHVMRPHRSYCGMTVAFWPEPSM
jgi:hypothetical protein